jgi:hypothetical protein
MRPLGRVSPSDHLGGNTSLRRSIAPLTFDHSLESAF